MAKVGEIIRLAEEVNEEANPRVILWPDEYAERDADTAFRFVTECAFTYDENSGEVEPLPKKEYIEALVYEWFDCATLGKPLIVEKSRRLAVSWLFRALMLWCMGLRRETNVVCGLNYKKAANHVWRIWFFYDEMRRRFPAWRLPEAHARDCNVKAMEVGQFMLANGSIVEKLNQDGESFQGSGYSAVDLEELSLYASPAYMYAQSLRVLQGKAGSTRGRLSIITNASPNKEWQEIKR